MKTVTRALRILAAVAVVSAGLVARSEATTISVIPSSATPSSPGTFTVDIKFDRLATDPEIAGFGLDLGFDGTKISGASVSPYVIDPDPPAGTNLDFYPADFALDFSGGFSTNSLNLLIVGGLNIPSPQSTSFTLARITFNALAPGLSNLTLSQVTFTDFPGGASFGPDTINDGRVCVDGDCTAGAPVPEPTTMLLFGTGLGALVMRRRRQQKSEL